jgi:hypothetical protein
MTNYNVKGGRVDVKVLNAMVLALDCMLTIAGRMMAAMIQNYTLIVLEQAMVLK